MANCGGRSSELRRNNLHFLYLNNVTGLNTLFAPPSQAWTKDSQTLLIQWGLAHPLSHHIESKIQGIQTSLTDGLGSDGLLPPLNFFYQNNVLKKIMNNCKVKNTITSKQGSNMSV